MSEGKQLGLSKSRCAYDHVFMLSLDCHGHRDMRCPCSSCLKTAVLDKQISAGNPGLITVTGSTFLQSSWLNLGAKLLPWLLRTTYYCTYGWQEITA